MLKGRQKKCLELMITGKHSQKEIAEMIGVTEQTIVNWKKNKEFIDEYNSALKKQINLHAAAAFRTEAEILKSGDNDTVRLNAAKDILDRAGFKPADKVINTTVSPETMEEVENLVKSAAGD